MTAILWALQAVLGSVFVVAATVRATRYEFAKRQMAWVRAVPRRLLLFISAAEILGALGLILPGVTDKATLVTAVAALCLGVVQLLALGFHVARHEPRNASANAVVLALLVFIAMGRLVIAPI